MSKELDPGDNFEFFTVLRMIVKRDSHLSREQVVLFTFFLLFLGVVLIFGFGTIFGVDFTAGVDGR